MSVIATTFNAWFVVERLFPNNFDRQGSPKFSDDESRYFLLENVPMRGRLTNYTASQSGEKEYAGEQMSRVLLKFFCPYRTDFQRGDRVTKVDDNSQSIPGPGNQATILNIANPGGENDHLMCACEERQEGLKAIL